jgi:hypothetical protein
MNQFEAAVAASDRVEDVLHQDALRYHFGRWIEVHQVASAAHKLSISNALLTGAGVSVTSGAASVNTAGIRASSQQIDFLQIEHQLIISQEQLRRVGQEKEQQVINNAKALIYEQYNQLFWDWYISGQSIATRAIDGSHDLFNPQALLGMQSKACVNLHEAKPTSYEGWCSWFATHIGQMQAAGQLLSPQLVMLIDMSLYREMENSTPSGATMMLSERLKRLFGLEIIVEAKLINTGKLLILDANRTCVKLIVGQEPDLLALRSGVVDGWHKMAPSPNQEAFHCLTGAILGNLLVLEEQAMLAAQLIE